MSPIDLFRFAFRALAGHRIRTGMSLLGIAIGVAAVIMLTAMGEGARRYVIQQFAALGTNLVIVLPGKNETQGAMPGFGGVPNDLTIDDALALSREIPAIHELAPISLGNETVAAGERKRQVPVLGSTHSLLDVRELSMSQGQFLPEMGMDQGSPVVVIGRNLARELFPGEDPVGKAVRIGDYRVRVVGVLGRRGVQLGMDMDDVVIVPVATAMKMFNKRSLFRILVKVRTHDQLPAVSREVVRVITKRHGEEDLTCITQDAVVSTFSSIINVLTAALTGIAAVSLSVAGIGVMNVMLVSVSERRGEVGLLKAVGVKRRQVLAVFLAEAALIGAAGGLVGLALGWSGVRLLVYIYPSFPAAAPAWAVASALVVSVVVGVVFGVLPAHRAARLDPVAAMARR